MAVFDIGKWEQPLSKVKKASSASPFFHHGFCVAAGFANHPHEDVSRAD
jgi:hypothetical protein